MKTREHIIHRAGAAACIALLISACENESTSPSPADNVARLAQINNSHFSSFTPIGASAVCTAPPATLAGFASYQPFVIAEGYSQTIIADEISDFLPVAGAGANLPDMLTLNETGPHAGRYLYRTHETSLNGAVTVTDLTTGITSLVDQEAHYEALDGLVWTPFRTLLFAEERIVAAAKDPRVPNAVGGLVYEWNPVTGETRPLPAIGARSHEGLRFDKAGNLYGISESTPNGTTQSGALFKFVPDRKGDLTSGQLYALRVLDPSETGEAVWVALDRDAVQVNSDVEAIAKGATGWARPEDIEIAVLGGREVMFVAVTGDEFVLRIELDGDNAFVSNFIDEGMNVVGLDNPDNVALDNHGNVYVAEDNGPGDIWMASPGSQRVATSVVRFASLSDCAAEPTGIYFDTPSKTLWVNVQHAGGALLNDLTLMIRKEN